MGDGVKGSPCPVPAVVAVHCKIAADQGAKLNTLRQTVQKSGDSGFGTCRQDIAAVGKAMQCDPFPLTPKPQKQLHVTPFPFSIIPQTSLCVTAKSIKEKQKVNSLKTHKTIIIKKERTKLGSGQVHDIYNNMFKNYENQGF